LDSHEINGIEKDSHLSSGSFSKKGRWPRHSRYEVVANDNGNLFIIPALDAALIFTNPFERQKELLQEFISLGKSCSELKLSLEGSLNEAVEELEAKIKNVDKNISHKALRFCNRYGLLGLFFHYQGGNGQRPEQAGGPLSAQSDSDTKVMELEYLSRFHPSPEYPAKFKLDQWFNFVGEQVSDIANEAEQFYSNFTQWNRFNAGGFDPEEEIIEDLSWREFLNMWLSVDSTGLGLNFDGSWQLEWRFQSLLEALKIMLQLDIATGQPLRLCECGELFRPAFKHQKRCCSSCSNTIHQRMHQSKKREVRALYEAGKSIEEIALAAKRKPEQIKKWLGL